MPFEYGGDTGILVVRDNDDENIEDGTADTRGLAVPLRNGAEEEQGDDAVELGEEDF